MAVHPSHKTRSSDSSFYDTVCTVCGLTDFADHLTFFCLGSPEAARIDILKREIASKENTIVELRSNLAKLEETEAERRPVKQLVPAAEPDTNRYAEAGVPIGDSGFFYEKGVVASIQLTKGDGKPGTSFWLDLLTSGGEVRWRKV